MLNMNNLFLIRDPLKYVASEYMDTYTKLNTIQSGLVDNLEMNKTDLNILKKYMDLCKMKVKNKDKVELLTLDVQGLHYSGIRFDRLSSLQFDKKNRTIYIIGSVINIETNYYFTDLTINSPELTLYITSINKSLSYTLTFFIKNYFKKKDNMKDFFVGSVIFEDYLSYNSNDFFRNVKIMGTKDNYH